MGRRSATPLRASNELVYDLAFTAIGVALLVVGALLARSRPRVNPT